MSITLPTTRVLIYLRKSRSKGFSLFAMDSRPIILMVKISRYISRGMKKLKEVDRYIEGSSQIDRRFAGPCLLYMARDKLRVQAAAGTMD